MTIIKNILIFLLKRGASRYSAEARLNESEVLPDPCQQFARWFELARKLDPEFANAMTLSTVSEDGQPSSRLVLLKEFDSRGFVFYTNYESRKARELTVNPRASLGFWWPEVYRQVRIEGVVTKVSRAESMAYFATRPRGSQLGAWASRQSAVLAGRAELRARLEERERRFAGQEVPCPPFWGGYLLAPERMEFWQGRQSRLHDRLLYRRAPEGVWLLERLSP